MSQKNRERRPSLMKKILPRHRVNTREWITTCRLPLHLGWSQPGTTPDIFWDQVLSVLKPKESAWFFPEILETPGCRYSGRLNRLARQTSSCWNQPTAAICTRKHNSAL